MATMIRASQSWFSCLPVALWIAMMWMGPGPAAARADVSYVVRNNDTLTSISRRYRLTVARLASYNGLKAKDNIYVGQRLLIPTNKTDPALSSALPKSLAQVSVSGRWDHIVIHHSGASDGDVKSMDRYHREERHMENGLAYHFVIGNGRRMRDGEIAVGERWLKQLDGGHLKSLDQNKTCIGICLVGNFDKQKPTPRQMENLRILVLYLMDRCKLDPEDILTHQQINILYTRCPGKYFPTSLFRKKLKATG